MKKDTTKPAVYLETSVIGYITSRPSRDLVVTARQQLTRDWFTRHSNAYSLFVSQLVVSEVSDGDKEAARERKSFLKGIALLGITDTSGQLATKLVECKAVPKKASEDALHIAIAAVHGVEYLLTWNCKHIANATLRQAIESACRDAGYEPPVICTPEELMNDEHRR
ncbi:MAG: type II toxin-antitoxin system VapC family toxin [Planctomycetes bacterium]|nr:type II toxin-antitoxin system VapC family toxin [Planctomycetota bacterium]NUQ34495.1 type II toxin-antitoxin system VapC family toxin [Planctomycetaceae bacterium]